MVDGERRVGDFHPARTEIGTGTDETRSHVGWVLFLFGVQHLTGMQGKRKNEYAPFGRSVFRTR